MNTRLMCGVTAVALSSVLSPPVAFAADDDEVEATPISVMGCVQRETEYRRQNNSGKGGFLGFGGGLGNEYVLIHASRNADGAFGDCATATGGEAYELTGSGEGELEAFVGQRVAVNGIRKAAEVDSETGRPTGGRQAGADLRLFEVDVETVRALAPPVQTGPAARPEPPPVAQQPEPAAPPPVEERRPDTSGVQRDELPRTASPLALAGLIGLLSLVGAAGLRARRQYRF